MSRVNFLILYVMTYVCVPHSPICSRCYLPAVFYRILERHDIYPRKDGYQVSTYHFFYNILTI